MEICSSPSLVDLAQRVNTVLRGGKIVFFHLPPIVQAEQWENELRASYSQGVWASVPFLISLDSCDNSPETRMQQELDRDAKSLEEALLRGPFCDSHVIVSVSFGTEPSANWRRLFGRLERLYERGSEDGTLRGLLFFCRGGNTGTPKPSPVTKHFYLWNPLRWEDMRCLGSTWLDGESTNPLTRAWQVSSYAGAANGDPFLLRKICADAPRFLTDLHHCVRKYITPNSVAAPPERMVTPRTEARWSVPEISLSQWREGRLLGVTLERGPQIPWEQIPHAHAERYVLRIIWQEQVTSLLPTLMEFTRQTGEWISRHVSQKWEKYIIEDGDPFTAVEPGKILHIFAKHKLGNLPDSLYWLLLALKDARNDLAHIAPMDSSSVNKVWNAYCVAQDRFGG